MTEREILKQVVEAWDHNGAMGKAVAAARMALRHDEPEHPAVVSYRGWMRELPIHTGPAEPFLAGWKQALEWAAQQPYFMHRSGGAGDTVLFKCARETPEHLP